MGLGIQDVLTDKRDEILRLAHQHGAMNVRVFGSIARGEGKPDSDVDFLVDWDYERISAWGGVGLVLDLEVLLGRKVEVGSVKELHWSIRERVLKETIRL